MIDVLQQKSGQMQCYQTDETGKSIPIVKEVTQTVFGIDDPKNNTSQPSANSLHIKEDGVLQLVDKIKYLT